ncbi:hypothetical protein K435DRAFT_832890 [Dendrothele bispora CBS 962.96]|uniref:Structure-specific endonuclease subunit SLX4 n=1 Tax=Dendrothele bispora (strain CBS 962.96) TaxID=1314807 RepID=A0A4S8MY98_DENBC|nr:hypothetical protein K435DRAFT_832890 [Dendrothele bispora CBS 962.96]
MVLVRSYSDEVVDDSEPEREAQRRAEAALKTLPKHVSRAASVQRTIEVIDISDDDETSPAESVDTRFRSIIEISDDSISPQATPATFALKPSGSTSAVSIGSTPTNGGIRPSIPVVNKRHKDVDDSSRLFFLPIPKPRDDTGSEDYPTLSLGRFAFTNARAGPSTLGLPKLDIVKPSVLRTVAKADAPPKKDSRVGGRRAVLDIPDDELSRLLKCVCCDSQWTTRKGTKQKLSHIQSCAKKHRLRDDTVLALIRKELKATLANDKGKGPAETPVETFFEEVMHDAAPKKRVRRQGEVAATVRNLSDTRDDILAKAKSVVTQNDYELRALREQCGRNDVVQYGDSSTPGFGQSKLAGRHGIKAISLFNFHSYSDVDTEDEENLLDSPTALRDTDAANIQSNVNPSILPHDIADPLSSSSSVTSPELSGTGQAGIDRSETESLRFTSNNDFYDDAYLHYDPTFDVQTPHDSPHPSDSDPLPDDDMFHPVTLLHSTTKSLEQVLPITNTIPKCKTPRKGKKKLQPESNAKSNEDWEQEIKDKILQDTDLHHRILRFEPIHFDVFLKLAIEESNPSGAYKNRLRTFLDKQSINFYGSEPTSRRRR